MTLPPPETLLPEITAWLTANAPAFEEPEGSVSLFFAARTAEQQAAEVERARKWEATKAAAGWAGLDIPTELGGRGWTAYEALLVAEEEGRYRLPLNVYTVTKGTVVPTLLACGSAAQRRRHVPPAIDGRELWCQLFSEPDAGSDLAALSTRAVETGDGWVVNGQKVWTSYAQYADFGYLLARTAPDLPKHRGISAFIVDMRATGVTVRPLRTATGSATFCEVFFDDVALPRDALIGPANEGWRVAITTLMNDRLALGSNVVPLDDLIDLARGRGEVGDPVVRAQLVDVWTQRRVLELLRERVLAAIRDGQDPGPEGSIAKLLAGRAVVATAEVATRLLGADALLQGPWTEFALGSPGLKVAGGTEEILKTIIGERVLGLPAEPRTDRDQPWSQRR